MKKFLLLIIISTITSCNKDFNKPVNKCGYIEEIMIEDISDYDNEDYTNITKYTYTIRWNDNSTSTLTKYNNHTLKLNEKYCR
jgi:hypothetical protein